jgi:hypothetical protein
MSYKSSTGRRLDILTRLITEHGTAFDRIEKAYRGPLFLEVAPLSFNIVVRQGARLTKFGFKGSRKHRRVVEAKMTPRNITRAVSL